MCVCMCMCVCVCEEGRQARTTAHTRAMICVECGSDQDKERAREQARGCNQRRRYDGTKESDRKRGKRQRERDHKREEERRKKEKREKGERKRDSCVLPRNVPRMETVRNWDQKLSSVISPRKKLEYISYIIKCMHKRINEYDYLSRINFCDPPLEFPGPC